ncbi:MAG: PadR family transcriptional regulator [Candidatus Thermoplasmatota archaeon]|nr:PadR family transcriptional regulator [Candidatus Thermoplasmatota archaeon]
MCEDSTPNCQEHPGSPEGRWIHFLILRVVCEKPLHGYGIIKRIEELSEGRHEIKSGTMYTTLRRMEKKGLLESEWKKSGSGPDKRVYSATEEGREHLKRWLEMIKERKRMMEKMTSFYEEEFGDG